MEIVGGEEIIGYDDGAEYVGAPPSARVPGLGAGRLVRDPELMARVQVLPFPVVTIPGGGTADIVAQPQRIMRVQRLVLTARDAAFADMAGRCDLLAFDVASQTQFVTSGAIPLLTFGPLAFGVAFRGSTCPVSGQVVVRVRNNDAAPITIGGCVFGVALS